MPLDFPHPRVCLRKIPQLQTLPRAKFFQTTPSAFQQLVPNVMDNSPGWKANKQAVSAQFACKQTQGTVSLGGTTSRGLNPTYGHGCQAAHSQGTLHCVRGLGAPGNVHIANWSFWLQGCCGPYSDLQMKTAEPVTFVLQQTLPQTTLDKLVFCISYSGSQNFKGTYRMT